MGFPHRRRLVTVLDVGIMAGGTPPIEPPVIPLEGLGLWFKADEGPMGPGVAADFTKANQERLTIPLNSTLRTTGPWTVGGWFYRYPGGALDMLMARVSESAGFDWQIYPYTDGSVIYQVYNNGSYGHIGIGVILAPVNQWHLLLCDYDGVGTFTMQINNATLVTGALGVLPDFPTGGVVLGDHSWTGGTVNAWGGRMQHWFMFGRLLNPTDRTYLWNAGNGRHFEELSTAFKTGLRAWWPLDELSGSRRDQSPNNNTLTDNNTVGSNVGKVLGSSIADNFPLLVWEDSGPNDLDVSNGTAGTQPTYQTNERNGKPVIRFDGNDFLIRTAVPGAMLMTGTEATLFCVVRANAGTGVEFQWGGSPDALGLYAALANIFYFDSGPVGSARFNPSAPALWPDTWHVAECFRSGTGVEILLDGNLFNSSNAMVGGITTATQPMRLGMDTFGASPLNGDIAELIIFNRALTADERVAVRDYLKLKWGISSNKLATTTLGAGYVLLNTTTNDRLAIN